MTPLSRRDFVSHMPWLATAGLAVSASPLAHAAEAMKTQKSSVAPLAIFNVREFGAVGDGQTRDTAALQGAIDACSAAGGGLVYFPAGRFLSGTISLKDNVTLHLSPSAVLLGSPEAGDYVAKPFPARDLDIGGFEIWSLVHADGAKNIGIEGPGTIDGNGKTFPPRAKIQPLDVASGVRPRAVFLKDCQRVTVRDVRIANSAMWSLHLARCENVFVESISVFTEFFVQQDGIVIDSSRDVRIAFCTVNTVDDALIFKSSFPQRCENITITGCVLTCQSSAIKFGTQSLGGFRNIAISNCVAYDCRLGGIKFEAIDGGTLEDVTVSNISMFNVSAPLFFKIGNRARDYGFKEVPQPQPIGALRNIVVSGLRATMTNAETLYQGGAINPAERRGYPMRVANTIIIGGLPDHPIENVFLSDIQITVPGGGTAEEAKRTDIPEEEKRYPENDMFGILPCWGFYIRHARGIVLRNVRLELAQPDLRTAFIADDVSDLELNGFNAAGCGAEHYIRLQNTHDARVQNCRPLGAFDTFVQVEGASERVGLVANETRHTKTLVRKAGGFDGAVDTVANLGIS